MSTKRTCPVDDMFQQLTDMLFEAEAVRLPNGRVEIVLSPEQEATAVALIRAATDKKPEDA